MEKMRLGRTEMMVSKLGFGGIPIQRISEDAAVAIVKRCLELGITFLDTANAYTTSEERIGKAIEGRKRDEVIIATKSTSRSREGVADHLRLSLEHLGVEYIDLYQFHQVGDFESLEIVLDPLNEHVFFRAHRFSDNYALLLLCLEKGPVIWNIVELGEHIVHSLLQVQVSQQ